MSIDQEVGNIRGDKKTGLLPPFKIVSSANFLNDITPTVLPTRFRDEDGRFHTPSDDLGAFFNHDLDLRRLNIVHPLLWLTGLPTPAQPLHQQLIMNRMIRVTEQADLHLTWVGSCLYLKPLPKYLLSRAVWRDHICRDPALYQLACGFFLSYTWLICHESDFHIAAGNGGCARLLPTGLGWDEWRTIAEDVLAHLSTPGPGPKSLTKLINQRYQYGELRLVRLNLIYRFAPRLRYQHLFKGYHNNYQDYSTFFIDNFAWLIATFAFFSVILNAMQVGLSTREGQEDAVFDVVSYRFCTCALLLLAGVVGFLLLLFAVLVFYNLVATIAFHRRLSSFALAEDTLRV